MSVRALDALITGSNIVGRGVSIVIEDERGTAVDGVGGVGTLFLSGDLGGTGFGFAGGVGTFLA